MERGGARPPLIAPPTWQPDFVIARAAFRLLEDAASKLGEPCDFPPVALLDRALSGPRIVNARGQRLRIVVDAPKPKRRRGARGPIDRTMLYDGRIHERAELPTRERSWHDLFGALQWATFPRSKARINARQWAALERWIPEGATKLPSARLREQDALAMLDEGGLALLAVDAALAEVRRASSESDLAALVNAVSRGELCAAPFGHALCEHLVAGHAPVRAMSVVLRGGEALPRGAGALAELIDTALALRLADLSFCASPEPHAALELVDALFAPTAHTA
jgi:hypothetical protein